MNNKMKITGLILAGYMLGRTKKLGLALTVASAVAGTTAAKNRDQLLGGLKDFADSSPELKSLQEKITGRLAESGKSAVRAVAAKGVDQLSVKLQDQTEKMKSTLDDAADSIDPSVDDSEAADDGEDAPQDENAPENSEESEADEAEPTDGQEADEEPQAEEEAPKKPAAKRSSTAKRSAKGTRSSKSSTASRGSRTKSGSKRSTTAKKTSTRAAAKPEEAEDE